MFCGQRGAAGVIDRDARLNAAHAAVHHHHRPMVSVCETPQKRIAKETARREKAVNPALLHASECRFLFPLIVRAEHKAKAPLVGASLGRPGDRDIKRVRQVRKKQSQRRGTRRPKTSCDEVGVVSQRPGGVANPLARRRPGAGFGMVVENPRHQAYIDARQGGDIADRRALAPWSV